MIAKNETENIAGCIRSIKPVVDEIIVVDTGSADDTWKIADELGAKVFDFHGAMTLQRPETNRSDMQQEIIFCGLTPTTAFPLRTMKG
jgi:glycosyltransferase involved in cell wall biosynthesis